MTANIAALDTSLPQVEADVRRIAAAGLLAEQKHQLADNPEWPAVPAAATPATDASYPGWSHHIAQAAALNELHRMVAEFNRLYPIGTPVAAYPGCRPEFDKSCTRLDTVTRSRASVLEGHTAVVWVGGYSSCIQLSHIDIRTGGAS